MNERRPIDKILKVASKVRKIAPNEYMISSPLRPDTNPSVHVTVREDDSLLIYDHGGGDTKSTLSAWGLLMSDLYPPGDNGNWPKPDSEKITAYDYVGKNGDIKYQVLRILSADGSKTFRQRRPNNQGGWIYNTRGIQPVPYRLPQLVDGLIRGEMIYVVEGEKDADTLSNLGLVATTNHGGAKKWKEEHSLHFIPGSKVSIIADNDEVGRQHAIQVADSLNKHRCHTRIIELPGLGEKGDVSDWLSYGRHTKEELFGIVQKAWEQQPIEHIAEVHEKRSFSGKSVSSEPVYICMSEIEEEEIEWVWPGYIANKKVCIIDGDPGVGKTWLGLFLAAAMSQGWEMPDATTGDFREGHVTQPRRNVIYMTAEDGLEDTLTKRLNLLGADSHHIYFLTGKRRNDSDVDMELSIQDTEVMRRAITDLNPAIIIVDPIQAFLGPKIDIHRANQVRTVMSRFSKLAEEGYCAVVLLRHLNKRDKGKPIYRGMGSVDFTAAARTVLMLVKDNDEKRIIFPIKNNLGAEGVPVSFSLNEEGIEWTGKDDRTIEEVLYPNYEQYYKMPRKNALMEAKVFLQSSLTTQKSVQQVTEEAGLRGISVRTLRRAREELGISSRKIGEQWYWSLPETQDIFQ